MLINTQIIRKLEPCKSRFNNYLHHYESFEGTLKDFILLDNITYSDKVWVVTRLFTKKQNVKWSLLCASKVLSIFEEKYPDDKRPRQALGVVEAWLNNPSEENRQIAYSAAGAAYSAAGAAARAAYAAYAADAAAYAAARAAAGAAGAAAYAASAACAARAAACAADAAAYAERTTEEEINLLLMLECI